MATKHFARWLSLTAVLLSAFGLVGPAGPLETAAAQDSGDVVRFSLGTEPPTAFTLCVGQKKAITVYVARETAQTRRFNQIHDIKVVSDIVVEAHVEDARVGSVSPGLGGLDEDLRSFTSRIDFKALGPGTTTIHFKTAFSVYRIPGSKLLSTPGPFPTQETLEKSLKVTVKKPCKAKVSSNQSWRNDNSVLTAHMDAAEILADDQGQFSGTGTVNWTSATKAVFGCEQSVSIDEYAPSQVDLTGQLDDSGQMTIKLNFQPVQDSVTVHCLDMISRAWTVNHYTVSESPQALSIIVPASDQAVTATLSQALVYGRQNNSIAGDAVLTVEPEPEQATSAQLERQIGRLGLADRFGFWPGAHETLTAGAH